MKRSCLRQNGGIFERVKAHFRVRSSATYEKIAEKSLKKAPFWPSELLFIKSNIFINHLQLFYHEKFDRSTIPAGKL